MSLLRMLPQELLTLVLLATSTYAIPQQPPSFAKNITTSAQWTTVPAWAHDESTQTGWETLTAVDDCPPDGTCAPFIIVVQPTATGFDSPSTHSVVVTNTPSVIEIHTNVLPPAGSSQQNNAPGEWNTYTHGGQPAPPAQTSDLLTDIITRIAQPGSQPTQNPLPTPVGDVQQSAPGSNEPQMQQATLDVIPGVTAAPEAQPSIVLGGLITLGAQTLTLTPGLSTTIGNDFPTYVAITTNTAGQTIIEISSSGTAVTATITNAPATITLPKTGFEASVTEAARPAGHDESSSAGAAAASTSSKGGAMEYKGEMKWGLGIMAGILGLGIAL